MAKKQHTHVAALEKFIDDKALRETRVFENARATVTRYYDPTVRKTLYVEQFKDDGSWDILVPVCDSNSITETLAAAEKYLRS